MSCAQNCQENTCRSRHLNSICSHTQASPKLNSSTYFYATTTLPLNLMYVWLPPPTSQTSHSYLPYQIYTFHIPNFQSAQFTMMHLLDITVHVCCIANTQPSFEKSKLTSVATKNPATVEKSMPVAIRGGDFVHR